LRSRRGGIRLSSASSSRQLLRTLSYRGARQAIVAAGAAASIAAASLLVAAATLADPAATTDAIAALPPPSQPMRQPLIPPQLQPLPPTPLQTPLQRSARALRPSESTQSGRCSRGCRSVGLCPRLTRLRHRRRGHSNLSLRLRQGPPLLQQRKRLQPPQRTRLQRPRSPPSPPSPLPPLPPLPPQ
jgi:hypothetical protein